jgi:flagellar biogenesis protein FliO
MHVAVVLITLATVSASAQTTRSAFEGQPIRRFGTEAPSTQASTTLTSGGAPQFLDLPRVLAALALVLGLIFILRWIVRKLFPNAIRSAASDVVRVLGRSAITPRQQILLVQVGQRVLVVADNGTQMSPLSEIKDADEVSSLIGQLNPGKATDGEAFRAALDGSQKEYEQPADEAASADASLAPAQTEIAGLMDKVRGLAKQLGR